MFFNDLVQINGDVDLDLMKVIHQSVLNQCDGFYVEYQPVVHAQTGEIVGAEALVRWKKEPYGIVPPGMFIDWLESNPCMYDLGNFVLKQALTDAVEFRKSNPDFLLMSICPQTAGKENVLWCCHGIVERNRFSGGAVVSGTDRAV